MNLLDGEKQPFSEESLDHRIFELKINLNKPNSRMTTLVGTRRHSVHAVRHIDSRPQNHRSHEAEFHRDSGSHRMKAQDASLLFGHSPLCRRPAECMDARSCGLASEPTFKDRTRFKRSRTARCIATKPCPRRSVESSSMTTSSEWNPLQRQVQRPTRPS